MAEEFIYSLDSYTAVVAREDIDGGEKRVMLVQNRRCNADNRILFDMTPSNARRIATRLRRYADFLEPPKPRKVVRRG